MKAIIRRETLKRYGLAVRFVLLACAGPVVPLVVVGYLAGVNLHPHQVAAVLVTTAALAVDGRARTAGAPVARAAKTQE
jgi:hypothetical protein